MGDVKKVIEKKRECEVGCKEERREVEDRNMRVSKEERIRDSSEMKRMNVKVVEKEVWNG